MGERWRGTIDGFAFPSGSPDFRIVFDSASGDGPRTGIVVFGAGAPPPPATDPHASYPTSPLDPPGIRPYEGFEYPIVEGLEAGGVIDVQVEFGGEWGLWCSLQTPMVRMAGGYGCVPTSVGDADTSYCYYVDPTSGAHVPGNCGWLRLCGIGGPDVCDCDASCCSGTTSLGRIEIHFLVADGMGLASVLGSHGVHATRE